VVVLKKEGIFLRIKLTCLYASANILNTPLETLKAARENDNLLLTWCLKGVILIKSLEKRCEILLFEN
jgi:hypothetical protein